MGYIENVNERIATLEHNTVKEKLQIKSVIESLKKGDNVKINYSYGKDVVGKVDSAMCGLYYTVSHHNYRNTFHYEKVDNVYDEHNNPSDWKCIYRVFLKIESQYNVLILDINEINTIEIDFTKAQYNAIDKAYNYCNLNSEDDDCIYKAINKYKALKDLTEDQQDKVYNILANRLGFK